MNKYAPLQKSDLFKELVNKTGDALRLYAESFDQAGTQESAARAYDRRGGGEFVMRYLLSTVNKEDKRRLVLADEEPNFNADEIRKAILDPTINQA